MSNNWITSVIIDLFIISIDYFGNFVFFLFSFISIIEHIECNLAFCLQYVVSDLIFFFLSFLLTITFEHTCTSIKICQKKMSQICSRISLDNPEGRFAFVCISLGSCNVQGFIVPIHLFSFHCHIAREDSIKK